MKKPLSTACLLLLLSAPCAASTLTAREYISAVLNASISMRKAANALAEAEAAYKADFLDAALPAFSLSLSDSFYDNYDPTLRYRSSEISSSLSASYTLYDSASAPVRRIRTAKLDLEQARLTYQLARQTEMLRALTRFYALYSAGQKVAVEKLNLAARERQFRDTNEQYMSGTRSRIEVTQSEGDKLQSELSVARAEVTRIKALMSFNELLDAEPETEREVTVSTAAPELALPLPRSDVQKALAGNLSLKRQRISLEKTRLSSRNSVASRLPRLRVDADWRKSGLGVLGLSGGDWNDDQTYGLGASLTYAFGFFGLQNHAKISATRKSLDTAEQDLRDAERSLRTSVLSAQKNIELQIKSRQLLEFQVKANRDAAGNLQGEYSLGGASSLQLDSAQNKLLDSSNASITAINDLDLALADYRALLGEPILE